MHELGIAQSALGLVLDQLRAHAATRVAGITLRIGSLAGVDEESLRFAFSTLLPGTAAEGAQVTIEAVEARAHCAACGIEFPASDGFLFACPQCGEFSGDVRQGRELDLARVELV